MITGHRLHKLKSYDIDWIKLAIEEAIVNKLTVAVGLSGMASGVDLWYCETLIKYAIPYVACPPFAEQHETMSEDEQSLRQMCMFFAKDVWPIRNSQMIEKADAAIVVFDGNKGGTHNCFQQLIEKQKPFVWINPVSKKIWECY